MRLKNRFFGGLFIVPVILVIQACSVGLQPQLGNDNVEKVIAAMTPEEKIGMTVGDGKFLPAGDSKSTEQGLGINYLDESIID